ncbi:MAG: hypothetical protein ACLF0P_06135 [Thermoanaerobaculia bacterium]
MSRTATPPRPARLVPEPDRFWIRYAPRRWPAAPVGDFRWLELARGRLGPSGEAYLGAGAPETGAPRPPELPPGASSLEGDPLPVDGSDLFGFPGPGPFDDVVHVPPVAAEHRRTRDRVAARVAAEGTPVLVQLLPGEASPEAEGVVAVYDLLQALLAGRPAALDTLPVGSWAAWPLVPGLTDDPELQEEGCRRLEEAGAAGVQAVVPELTPAERRRLYEAVAAGRDEAVFDALFHGPAPDPRAFARTARRHGLGVFFPRPLPRPPLAGAAEREAAGLLALAGEICLRLGEVGRGQAFLRAARWIDRTDYDLRALAREGNLPVLHWLEGESRQVVEEWAAEGRSAIAERWVTRYARP